MLQGYNLYKRINITKTTYCFCKKPEGANNVLKDASPRCFPESWSILVERAKTRQGYLQCWNYYCVNFHTLRDAVRLDLDALLLNSSLLP